MANKFSEHELLLRLEYLLGGQRILVDVGAHTGGFARPFTERGWQVIAFEPEPTNYQQLCANLRDFPNVTCIAKAVSDTTGQGTPFYVSSDHWGIHSLKPFHPTHRPTLMVDTVRLDETLANMQIDQVTVLKIDIEGADFLALKSFDFNGFQPEVVMCEFMDERSQPNFGYTHHDMAAYMIDLGYATFVSEWAPIVEYGRKGVATVPHRFLQCVPYPLDHDPAWGNLIFVPKVRSTQFECVLSAYLEDLERFSWAEGLCSFLRVLPGARPLYHALLRMRQTLSGVS
jgi:FkbM family methyltransferase